MDRMTHRSGRPRMIKGPTECSPRAHASVSPRHLTRCFAQELGISPITYLHRWRIRQARRLLDETSQSITDIAAAADSRHPEYPM